MEIKNILKFAIPIFLMLFSSCYTENKHTVDIPDKLFTESEMVDIMTDVQIIEGALNHNRIIQRWNNDDKEPYYTQVFLKHNMTANDFKQNLNYYNSNPAVMQRIFEKVIENINQQIGIAEIEISKQITIDSLRKIEIYNDSLRVLDSLLQIKTLADSLLSIDSLSTDY